MLLVLLVCGLERQLLSCIFVILDNDYVSLTIMSAGIHILLVLILFSLLFIITIGPSLSIMNNFFNHFCMSDNSSTYRMTTTNLKTSNFHYKANFKAVSDE